MAPTGSVAWPTFTLETAVPVPGSRDPTAPQFRRPGNAGGLAAGFLAHPFLAARRCFQLLRGFTIGVRTALLAGAGCSHACQVRTWRTGGCLKRQCESSVSHSRWCDPCPEALLCHLEINVADHH